MPGGRQAQVVDVQVAVQQLGDAFRDTERGECHELRQLQGAQETVEQGVLIRTF